jgi:tRNA nucleotidyltransferase (CCA-adding enzyme)
VIRALHRKSFLDDPTRALRAARYAARFGYDLAPQTADLLAGVDLDTVSADRVAAELELVAGEETAVDAMRLVSRWGLIEVGEDRLDLAETALELVEQPAWVGIAGRREIVRAAIAFDRDRVGRELGEAPPTPFMGVELADRFTGADLLLARSMGIAWLDDYRSEWSRVELEITGADLLEAGIPEGPAIGIGMSAALAAKLDRGVTGADEELRIACEAAARGSGRD